MELFDLRFWEVEEIFIKYTYIRVLQFCTILKMYIEIKKIAK